jgi:hypothetical protein
MGCGGGWVEKGGNVDGSAEDARRPARGILFLLANCFWSWKKKKKLKEGHTHQEADVHLCRGGARPADEEEER